MSELFVIDETLTGVIAMSELFVADETLTGVIAMSELIVVARTARIQAEPSLDAMGGGDPDPRHDDD